MCVPRYSISTRLIRVVAHVRVNALGGSHDRTSCTVCMHVHLLQRKRVRCTTTEHTVLIPVKKSHPSAQNNARFWMFTNVSARGLIMGFYGCVTVPLAVNGIYSSVWTGQVPMRNVHLNCHLCMYTSTASWISFCPHTALNFLWHGLRLLLVRIVCGQNLLLVYIVPWSLEVL